MPLSTINLAQSYATMRSLFVIGKLANATFSFREISFSHLVNKLRFRSSRDSTETLMINTRWVKRAVDYLCPLYIEEPFTLSAVQVTALLHF